MPSDDDTPYIERVLRYDGEALSADDLSQRLGVAIILAEPGAGKTRLLEKLADLLGIPVHRASIFRHKQQTNISNPLLIDAFDEAAKLDQSAIDQIIVKAFESGANRVVFASRSGEWDEARTQNVRDCFSVEPMIVRLDSFTRGEQEQYFQACTQGEDFNHFEAEVERMDLFPLAGNPQFLKMLIDAYLENERKFESKDQIFRDSVRAAVREINAGSSIKKRPAVEHIICHADEIFAALLLSGASGVSVSDIASSRDHPSLNALFSAPQTGVWAILDTKLFKPGRQADHHEPTHKIIAEYCAARFLTGRIKDQSNSFSLGQALSIIAPNSVVRDELRGLLGWMAAFGDQAIQEGAIRTDPYAVLANGDPGKLSLASKRLLLKTLEALWEEDPNFRRMDRWRRFNVSGFFTPDLFDEVGNILSSHGPNSTLKELILELLQDVKSSAPIEDQLMTIVRSGEENVHHRELALDTLTEINPEEKLEVFRAMTAEATRDSLCLAAHHAEKTDIDTFPQDDLLSYVRKLATLYSSRRTHREKLEIGSRYFIREFFQQLKQENVEYLLDEMSASLRCTCKRKRGCECNMAESKVIGYLLDRYFELGPDDCDAQRFWCWTKNLNFEDHKKDSESLSVRTLAENPSLRQAVQRLAFEGMTDPEDIWNLMLDSFMWRSHSGLAFRDDDTEVLAQYAFNTGNLPLWDALWVGHNIYQKQNASHPMRRLMREHASLQQKFQRLWARKEQASRTKQDDYDKGHRRSMRRWKLRDRVISENNRQHYEENRSRIERGEHWWWLQQFAMHFLYRDEADERLDYVDISSMEKALRNSFPLLADHIPTLHEAALRQKHHIVTVLHAACLAWFRHYGNLEGVDLHVLRVVRPDCGGYRYISDEESAFFMREINRRIFPDGTSLRQFAKDYMVPQLRSIDRSDSDVSWLLQKPEFDGLREELALEWLEKYPEIPFLTAEYLFKVGTQHPDRNRFSAIVKARFETAKTERDVSEDKSAIYDFWALRSFLYLPLEETSAKEWLKKDKKHIFGLEHIVGTLHTGDNSEWVNLGTDKVFYILDAYVDEWPKVFLPSCWGTGDPDGQRAYRFLTEIIWAIRRDEPSRTVACLDRILGDTRFTHFHDTAKTLRAGALRQKALHDFEAPSPQDITAFLANKSIVSVESLRALLLEQLLEIQKWLKGAPTDPIDVFYEESRHVDEPTAAKRVAEYLEARFKALNLSVAIEFHMKNSKRCDITVSTVINGRQIMLVIEAKGQWHKDLFTAAREQLHKRYSIHPDAADQGVYLVFWYGPGETVAGNKTHNVQSAEELRAMLIESLDRELQSRIDVIVLDLQRPQKGS